MNYKEYISTNKLKRLRQERSALQKDIAASLKMCVTDRLSHWEKGTAIPSIVNLFRLAAIYQVLPHELYPELYKKITDEIQTKTISN